MSAVTISPKFQIVIPLEVRQKMGLEPGQKVQVMAFDDRIQLVPLRRAKALRGFLRGIDTRVEREPDRK